MQVKLIILLSLMLLLLTPTCSMYISAIDVPGEYEAVYPFGTSHLTIQNDGTFKQSVVLENSFETNVVGTWQFEPIESKISVSDMIVASSPFGKLRPNWTKPKYVSHIPVEIIWLKVNIELNENFPFVKQ